MLTVHQLYIHMQVISNIPHHVVTVKEIAESGCNVILVVISDSTGIESASCQFISLFVLY